MGYFLATDPGFGRLAWIFFVFQLFVVAAGAYLRFAHRDRFVYRQQLFGQIGIALLIIGGAGALVGVLRLFEVSVFNARYWFYIQLLIELAIGGYMVYYFRTTYPAEMTKAKANRQFVQRSSAVVRKPQPAPSVPAEPRPEAKTSRRDARRDRKRRKG